MKPGIGIGIGGNVAKRNSNLVIPITGLGTGDQSIKFGSNAIVTVTIVGGAGFKTEVAGEDSYASQHPLQVKGNFQFNTLTIQSFTGTAFLIVSNGLKSIHYIYWIGTYVFPNVNFTAVIPYYLQYLLLYGANSCWTYSGTLPSTLKTIDISTAGVNWTISGSLPSGMTTFQIGANAPVNFLSPQVIPQTLTILSLLDSALRITLTGAFSPLLTYIYLSGDYINWSGLDVSGTANIPAGNSVQMLNYRTGGDENKLTGADLVTLLASFANHVGALPTIITVKEYLNAGTSESPTVVQINTANPLIDGTVAEQAKYWLAALIAKAPNNPHTVNISKA